MTKLWIDTATDFLFLAITQDNRLVESLVVKADKKHSDIALYTIQDCLRKNNISANDIQNIYIGAGPGSYSGIRIARMIAKTVQLVSPITCYQFSTLQLIHNVTKNNHFVLRAGKDVVYARVNNQDQLESREESYLLFDKTVEEAEINLTYEALDQLEIQDIQNHLPNYLKAAI